MSNDVYRIVGRQMSLWTLETGASVLNFLVPWWVAGKIADNTDPTVKEVQDGVRNKLDTATNIRPISWVKSLYKGMDGAVTTVLNFTDRTLNRSTWYQSLGQLPFFAGFERRYKQMKNYVILNALWQRFVKPFTKEYLWDRFAVIPASYLSPYFGAAVRFCDDKLKALLAATYIRGGAYSLKALENSFSGYIRHFQDFLTLHSMKPVGEGVFISEIEIEQMGEKHLEILTSVSQKSFSAFNTAVQYGVQSLDWSCAKIDGLINLGVNMNEGLTNYKECLSHVNSTGFVDCTQKTANQAYENGFVPTYQFIKTHGEPMMNWTASAASDLAQWAQKNVWEEQLKVMLNTGVTNSSAALATCQPYVLPAAGAVVLLGFAAFGAKTVAQKLWSTAGTVNNNNHSIHVTTQPTARP